MRRRLARKKGAQLNIFDHSTLIKSKHSSISDEVLLGFIARVVRADRLLAVISNQEAASAGAKPKKIAEDLKKIAKGDEEAAKGHADNAIKHYGNAWRHAVHLMIKGVKHLASGALQMEFLGLEEATYIIQTSTNMVDWVTLGTCMRNDNYSFSPRCLCRKMWVKPLPPT